MQCLFIQKNSSEELLTMQCLFIQKNSSEESEELLTMQCLLTKHSFFHLESKYSKSPKQK